MNSANLSPFFSYGLWRNPFGELSPAERAEAAIVEIEKIVAHLTDTHHCVQLIGGCGYGKTTHLLAIQAHLKTAKRVYFPEDGPRPTLPSTRPLLIDEAQRMSWLQKRKIARGSGPLAIGTHEDLRPLLAKNGFSVLSIDVEEPAPASVVARILNRRLQLSALQQTQTEFPIQEFDIDTARTLQKRFGSNLRAIEHYLYQQLQDCVKEQRRWLPAN